MSRKALSYKNITPKLESEIARDFAFLVLYGGFDERIGYHNNNFKFTHTPDSFLSYLLEPDEYTLTWNPDKYDIGDVEEYRKARNVDYKIGSRKFLFKTKYDKLRTLFDWGNVQILAEFYNIIDVSNNNIRGAKYIITKIYPQVLNKIGDYVYNILDKEKPYIERYCGINGNIREIKIEPSEEFIYGMNSRCDNFINYICDGFNIELPIFNYKSQNDKIYKPTRDGKLRLFASLKRDYLRDKYNKLTHIKERISIFDKNGRKHNSIRFVDMLL